MSQRKFTHSAWLVLLVLTLSACAQPGLYPAEEPLLQYEILSAIKIPRPEQDKPLSLRAIVPEAAGRYPLIVLSHGTFSSNERYDRVAGYWASQGYIVIMPQHIDANYGIAPKGVEDMLRIVETRVADLSLVLDNIKAIETSTPELNGKIAHGKYIAAGHSIGTLIAMRVTGLVLRNAASDQILSNDESRYKLLVMLSDPGKMRQMPETAWAGSIVPTFLCTGTDDYGLMGARGAPQDPNEILSSSNTVDRYQVILKDGDHYFGGLVQKDVAAEPDHEGLVIFNTTSTAFMDAYMKNDSRAKRHLQNVDMQLATSGRAELIRMPGTR